MDLVAILADAQFHAGTDLGRCLGITRAAVSKAVQVLRAQGLPIERQVGRGYRLAEPLIPLYSEAISRNARGCVLAEGDGAPIAVFPELPSTSAHLLARATVSGEACLAEVQTAGRGRRGRAWHMPPYRNIALSVVWHFERGAGALAGLSLAMGVAVRDALHAFGVPVLALKWPNDILGDGRKLAGLLLNVQGEAHGLVRVAVGVGVNVAVPPADAAQIAQPLIDLHTLMPQVRPIDRNELAGLLIRHLRAVLREFAHSGFALFHARWEQAHAYAGRPVRIIGEQEMFDGIAEGVTADGALCVRAVDGRTRYVQAADVSLRAAP